MVIRQTHGTCPYCNAVIKNYSLRAWFSGSPISTCKKCGNLYIDRRYHEMAVDGAAPDEFDVKKRNRQTSQSFVPRHNRFIGGQQPVKIVLNIQTVSTGSNCKGVYQRTCRCSIVTITYGGKSTEQKIAVSKAEVSGIVIKTAPTKTNYVEGEKFDLTGLVLTVTYNNGKTEDIAYGTENAADFTVTPSGALSESDTSVTITYGGKSTEQKIAVIVIATISSFDVTSSGVVVKYTVTGSTAVKSQTLKFSEVTEEMVELMKSKDIQLVIDFVNYSTAGSDTIILTSAQIKAIEYVLEHDFGIAS